MKPFLRIDDVEGILRPTFVENIPVPILKVDAVENDGCPFAGYDKKHRESRKKNAKKAKDRDLQFLGPFFNASRFLAIF